MASPKQNFAFIVTGGSEESDSNPLAFSDTSSSSSSESEGEVIDDKDSDFIAVEDGAESDESFAEYAFHLFTLPNSCQIHVPVTALFYICRRKIRYFIDPPARFPARG